MASQDLSQEIEDDILSCPICNHQLTQPKALPCLHTYCCTCLQHLAQRAENGHFSCPECRKVVAIPAQGVQALPTNFLVANVLEKVQKCKAEREKKADNTDMCDTHNQEAHVVCVNCQVVVCNTCLQSDHKEHELKHVDQEKSNILSEVKAFIGISTHHKDPFKSHQHMQRLQQNFEEVTQQIEARAAELIHTVNHQKDSLLKELNQRRERKLGKINKQETQYRGSEIMLQSAIDEAEKAIHSNKPLLYKDILPQKRQLRAAVAKRGMYFASLLEEKGGLKFERTGSVGRQFGRIVEESDSPSGSGSKTGPESEGTCGASGVQRKGGHGLLRRSADKKKLSPLRRARTSNASDPVKTTASPSGSPGTFIDEDQPICVADLIPQKRRKPMNKTFIAQPTQEDPLFRKHEVFRAERREAPRKKMPRVRILRDHDSSAGEGTSRCLSTASELPTAPKPRCKVLHHPQVGVNATTSTGSADRASSSASASRSRSDDAVQHKATGPAASSGSGSNGHSRRPLKRTRLSFEALDIEEIFKYAESDEDGDVELDEHVMKRYPAYL